MSTSTGQIYVGGGWAPSSSGDALTRRCPLDDCTLGPYADASSTDVDMAVASANAAAPSWGSLAASERAAVLHRIAAVIERHASELADTMTHEEGKRLSESLGETTYAVSLLRYFAGYILASEGSIVPGSERGVINLYRRRPLGPVALVTPWNFPLLVPMRKMAPALAFGNTVVWKPASDAPETAVLLVRLLDEEANIPAGVINLVTGRGSVTGEYLVRHPGLKAVSFTGSTEIGRRVQRGGFDRSDPIRVQVEMGGKNVLIVTDDADVSFAVKVALDGVMKGSGQRCTATGLVLVQESALDRFLNETGARVRALRVGPGADPKSDVTPLVSQEQLERAHEIVDKSMEMGLVRVAEASVPSTAGWYIAPALMSGTTREMPVVTSEIFAPILPVASYRTDAEAIELANSLPYGLSASIVTPSIARALRFVDTIQAGVVKVNQETGSSESNFPFGGWKGSGYGPMEQGLAAVGFYTEEQTVHLVPGPFPSKEVV
jgi:acyl-CoA reductase-like NAD-dependent aldehyde dehydrogenase